MTIQTNHTSLSGNEVIELALWQYGRRLAHFHGRIGQLLRQDHWRPPSSEWIDADILLHPSNCFPGIIGPKIKMKYRLEVTDTSGRSSGIRRLTGYPQESVFSSRQKSVCHTRYSTRSNSMSSLPSAIPQTFSYFSDEDDAHSNEPLGESMLAADGDRVPELSIDGSHDEDCSTCSTYRNTFDIFSPRSVRSTAMSLENLSLNSNRSP